MERHQFKVIFSNEDDVYRILDLTDTSIVGVTEMFETAWDRESSIEKNREIKAKKVLGAKVVNYGIFICLDEDNMRTKPEDDTYLSSILRQMAVFFKETEIDPSPDYFKEYYVPSPRKEQSPSPKAVKTNTGGQSIVTVPSNINNPTKKKENKWLPVVIRVILIIVGGAALIALMMAAWWGILMVICALAFLPELFGKR